MCCVPLNLGGENERRIACLGSLPLFLQCPPYVSIWEALPTACMCSKRDFHTYSGKIELIRLESANGSFPVQRGSGTGGWAGRSVLTWPDDAKTTSCSLSMYETLRAEPAVCAVWMA